ncbi:MAG: IS200/IS605 family transposase [Gemmatimonadales bacterium]
MRHAIYLHIVWTTLGRAPLIDHEREHLLRRYLRHIAREERAIILELGMVSTHLHLLLRVHPACRISRLLQRWKGGSAFLSKRDGVGNSARPLRWAKGYSVTSVGPRALPAVLRYITDQPERHPSDRITAPDVVTDPPRRLRGSCGFAAEAAARPRAVAEAT